MPGIPMSMGATSGLSSRAVAIGSDDFVERIGDLAVDAGPVAGQLDGEIAVAHAAQHIEQYAQIERRFAL